MREVPRESHHNTKVETGNGNSKLEIETPGSFGLPISDIVSASYDWAAYAADSYDRALSWEIHSKSYGAGNSARGADN